MLTTLTGFQFPEWRLGLEEIDEKLTSCKRRLAVGTADTDKHYLLAQMHSANPVNYGQLIQRPALTGLSGNLPQNGFCHPGIVFQRQVGNRAAIVEVAHLANKGHHGAVAVVGGDAGIFGRDIEVGGLYQNTIALHLNLRLPVGRRPPRHPL